MQADLHIHTNRYSGCSNIHPAEAIEAAARAGLDLIALTEHGIRWPDRELDHLLAQYGRPGLVVLPGQEVACYRRGVFQGEFLVFGYPESLGSNQTAEQLITTVHDQGGVVIAAHPFKKAKTGGGFYGSGHLTGELDLDGLEVLHPSYDRESRRLAWQTMTRMKTVGLSCSDAHDSDQIGLGRSLLPDRVESVEELCQAIRRGRVVPAVNDFARPLPPPI